MLTPIALPKNRLPKILAGVLLSAALCVAAPAAASAHTPAAAATCSTLSVDLQNYVSSADAPTPNSVTVVIDGAESADVAFGHSYAQSFPLGDETAAHAWSVAIDAVDNEYDTTLSGTSTPCAPAPVQRQESADAVDCSTKTVTTTTTTTTIGSVYDTNSDSWVAAEPTTSVTTSTRPTTTHDCSSTVPTPIDPTDPEPQVPVTPESPVLVVDSQVTPEALAHTGIESAPWGIAALGLLALGLALAWRGRQRMS